MYDWHTLSLSDPVCQIQSDSQSDSTSPPVLAATPGGLSDSWPGVPEEGTGEDKTARQ